MWNYSWCLCLFLGNPVIIFYVRSSESKVEVTLGLKFKIQHRVVVNSEKRIAEVYMNKYASNAYKQEEK